MTGDADSRSPVWSMAGGGSARTGRFGGAVKLASAPERRLPARGSVQAPVVFDGEERAFVADMAGTVRAYSTEGRMLWEQTLEGGIKAGPAVGLAIGRLFVGTLAGWVYALDTRSGTVVWRTGIPSATDPRLLADLLMLPGRGLVVVSSWGGRFCALAAEQGETRFTWDAGLSPCVAASADADGHLYCLRARREVGVELVRVEEEGRETIWHTARGGPRGPARTVVAAAPVIDAPRRRLYLILNDDRAGQLCAWSLDEGALLWRHPFERAVLAAPAVREDGTVLVADMTGRLAAVAPDGSLAFQFRTDCEYLLAAPVCDASGQAWVGDPTGALHRLEPGGEGRLCFEAPRALQAQASFDGQGRLYVPCTDRHVYVFRNLAAT